MKKIFTIAMALLMGFSMAYAQDDELDDTFTFQDADGNVIENGATVTATGVTTDAFGSTMIKSGVYVKNNYGTVSGVRATATVVSMDNGQVQYCFPMTCYYLDKPMVKVSSGSINGDEVKDIQTEWMPTADGTCTMTLKLETAEWNASKFAIGDVIGEGPTITIKFVYGTASVNNVNADNAKVVGRYNVAGATLSAPQKGLNIVKMSDGSTRKVVVR